MNCFDCEDSDCREIQRFVADQTGMDLRKMSCEHEERYDCVIHGLQNGSDCPRC